MHIGKRRKLAKVDPELLIKPKLKMRSYSAGKWSSIRCQKVLKQYCHKSVLRIKQKLKKMDLTSCVITEKHYQSFIFSERFN